MAAKGWGKLKSARRSIAAANYWTEMKTDDGQKYYYNTYTEQTAWERPPEMDMQTKGLSDQGKKYQGSLKKLSEYRNKKKYNYTHDDHLKMREKASKVKSLFSGEKVMFSDHAYRHMVDGTGGHTTTLCRLIITTAAVYDFDRTDTDDYVGLDQPSRRIPFAAVIQLGKYQKFDIFFFRLRGERKRNAVRYYNERAEHISNICLRYYCASVGLGLKQIYLEEVPPADLQFLKRANDKNGKGFMGAVSQAQAVARFRGGLVSSAEKKCNYCHLECSGDARRNGQYYYHAECDPRERAMKREQANKDINSFYSKFETKLSGKLAQAREKLRKEKEKRAAERKAELEKKIKTVLVEQEKEAKDRQREIQRRKDGIEAIKAKYEADKAAVKSGMFCVSCNKAFEGGEYYCVQGSLWHKDCLVCQGKNGTCRKPFTKATGYYVRDNLPHCRDCHFKNGFDRWLANVGERVYVFKMKRKGKPATPYGNIQGTEVAVGIEMANASGEMKFSNPMRNGGNAKKSKSKVGDKRKDHSRKISNVTGYTAKRFSAVPDGWARQHDGKGNAYYVQHDTGESSWEKPASGGKHSREISSLPTGFVRQRDEDGNKYYIDTTTGESSWEKPAVGGHEKSKSSSASSLGSPLEMINETSEREAKKEEEEEEKRKTKKKKKKKKKETARMSTLPDGWLRQHDDDGNKYYIDHETGESTWEKPAAAHGRGVSTLPSGWVRQRDADGNKFYINAESGESTWEKPDN